MQKSRNLVVCVLLILVLSLLAFVSCTSSDGNEGNGGNGNSAGNNNNQNTPSASVADGVFWAEGADTYLVLGEDMDGIPSVLKMQSMILRAKRLF